MRVRFLYKVASWKKKMYFFIPALTLGAGAADYINDLYATMSGMTPEQAKLVSLPRKLVRMPQPPGENPAINFEAL